MSIIRLKTIEEIAQIKENSILLSSVLEEIAKHIKEGVTTLYLDKIAHDFILDNKAIPAFLGYGGFPNTLCISPNEQVVHGIPSKYVIKDGDVISVDCGVLKNDYYSDSAYTFAIGNISKEAKKLLDVTKECLKLGISKACVGNRVGDIGNAIQTHAESCKYGVVRELVGHGIGKKLHEKPEVPNFGKQGHGVKLEHGMVIAIEPMINMGTSMVRFWEDGWTVTTKDKKISAHFEHTVAILDTGVEVLTSFDGIDKVLNK